MNTGTRILIIDDDERICRTITRYLQKEAFKLESCSNSKIARILINSFNPHLVLLDLNLPDGSGFDIASEIRKQSNIGIIIISGTIEQVDKIVSLEIGADDFLSKPLNLRELLARIRGVLRRVSIIGDQSKSEINQVNSLSFNGWTLDLDTHELSDPEGRIVKLTSHEFKLLAYMASNTNRILNRYKILDHMGHKQWSPMDRSIDVMIAKLRKKIELPDQKFNPILTIRGEGYKFVSK